jgi:hypothetical protein
MKSSINQIKGKAESIISRQDQTEERILGIKDKVKETLHLDSTKEKINKHDYNLKNSGTQSRGQA